MSSVDKAIATQLANIEKRTGKTLAQLTAIVKKSGLEKNTFLEGRVQFNASHPTVFP